MVIQYVGIAGSSQDGIKAVVRLIQGGAHIPQVKIVTRERRHALLLFTDYGDLIAVKAGFSSGYGGEGPRALSFVLAVLQAHGAAIEEIEVPADLLSRLDDAGLTSADLAMVEVAGHVKPSRWREYISDSDLGRARSGELWRGFAPVIPYAILDPRLMDLALSFWSDPDACLSKGYRRLEDIVRRRTGLSESSTKLFNRAFDADKGVLAWKAPDTAERTGRAQLFVAVYMAFRNPRAHREHVKADHLTELLMLNSLFRLEAEAVERPKDLQVS